MVRAEQADNEQVNGEALPEEIAHRNERLAQIRRAKEMIEERATQRYETEQAAYEQKMTARRTKEKQTGKNIPGRKPQPPEPGPRDKDQVNFTDPESRIMLTSSSGWQQAWNLQNSVDMNSYMILGGHVSQATNDKQQLSPALDSLESLPDSLGKTERVAADAGYYSKDNTENAISWR